MAKPSRRRRRERREKSFAPGEGAAAARVGPDPRSDEAILVNELTVGSAVHLVKTEGGAVSARRLLFRGLVVLVVAAFMARAIAVGRATVWHLFLPMVAEYLVLLFALPFLNLALHDPGLQRDARRALRWIGGLILIVAAAIAWRAYDGDTGLAAQARADFRLAWEWIRGHETHWPILAAAVAMATGLPGRVAAFHRHGPPFLAVGPGCAMRVVVAMCGGFLLPFALQSATRAVWAVWGLLLVSELAALWMLWDLQVRLRKRGIEV